MYITHQLLLRWLLFVTAVAVGLTVAWHQGLFHILFKNDASRLSIVIIGVFILSSLHAGWLILRLSKFINHVNTISNLMDRDQHSQISVKNDEVVFGYSAVLPDGPMTDHIQRLARRLSNSAEPHRYATDQSQLLDALSRRIKSPQQLGWLIADLMIKLGLLGTVIGFILMLQSVPTVEDIDISTIQTMLSKMSDGMRVALFTTLCGLIGGVLAGIQYHIADRGADELVAGITEVSEIHVAPRLANGNDIQRN
jgi:biopolymer transport protein ExbB/TolQ